MGFSPVPGYAADLWLVTTPQAKADVTRRVLPKRWVVMKGAALWVAFRLDFLLEWCDLINVYQPCIFLVPLIFFLISLQ